MPYCTEYTRQLTEHRIIWCVVGLDFHHAVAENKMRNEKMSNSNAAAGTIGAGLNTESSSFFISTDSTDMLEMPGSVQCQYSQFSAHLSALLYLFFFLFFLSFCLCILFQNESNSTHDMTLHDLPISSYFLDYILLSYISQNNRSW